MTNETTASERERFEAWLRECGYCEFARSTVPETYADNAIHHRWQGWQARAALPAPADQGSAEMELGKLEAWLLANPEAWPCMAGSPVDVAIAVMASRRKDHP